MKKPNGYGSVIKLSGARRKPYAVRMHVGRKENGTCIYQYIGYYSSRKEAEIALAEYNAHPYSLDKMTFAQVYADYAEHDMLRLTDGTQKVRKGAYKRFSALHNVPFCELKPMQVQEVIDGITPVSQGGAKAMYVALEAYALKIEATSRCFGNALTCASYSPKKQKSAMPEDLIEELWKHTDNEVITIALILVYTGLRINEFLELTTDSINDGCIIGGSKTEAGKNRIIPIHHRILPLVDEMAKMSRSGALCEMREHTLRRLWREESLLDGYTFHECRHTFRTRLDNLDANEKCIDLLMGHVGNTVGKRVYTHKTIEQLKETIEMLK